jgi:hypothetical protein
MTRIYNAWEEHFQVFLKVIGDPRFYRLKHLSVFNTIQIVLVAIAAKFVLLDIMAHFVKVCYLIKYFIKNAISKMAMGEIFMKNVRSVKK